MNIALLVWVAREGADDYDVSVTQIAETLRGRGHGVAIRTVHGDLDALVRTVRADGADLVFNLLEQFGDGNLGLVQATGVLELLGVPFTGSGAGEIYLQEDKALTKRLLAFEQIRTPDFAVFTRDADFEAAGHLRMPLFVKPLRQDASFGIEASRSLVHDTASMIEQVARLHREFDDAVLCEQFIEGREFYVGVLGNRDATAFPPIEIDFSGMPPGAPHVMDGKAKFEESSAEYRGSRPVVADIPSELRARLQEVALRSYRALRVRDYGRIDLRVTDSGDIYVIEVNANCYLERDSEFASAAAAAGIDYPTLIERIATLAVDRHHGSSVRMPRIG